MKKHAPLLYSFIAMTVTVIIWQNGGAPQSGTNELSLMTILALITAEIALGFLVAWILIFFVEVPAQKESDERFQQKQKILSRNIFDYIYGVRMPKSLFKFVEANFLKSKFYRKKLLVEYNFIRKVGDQWLIRMDAEFDVQNLSDKTETYSIRGTTEKCHLSPGDTDVDSITELGLVSLHINHNSMDSSALQAAQSSIPDTDETYRYQEDIKIPANKKVNIKVSYIMLKHARDSEFWRTMDSASALKLKIQHPEGMKIHVSAIHPSREFTYQHSHGNNVSVEINSPLTPQNGVLFWWG